MAKFEAQGFDNLFKRLDTMGNAPTKVKKQLVNQSANVVLNQMKTDASSMFQGTGEGARNLSILQGRSGENYLFLDIGINESNWYQCRGLYFQHYGFKSKSATLWMNSSFKKAKPKMSKLIKEGLRKELKL